MPARAGAKHIKRIQQLVIGQHAQRMAAVGVTHHEQGATGVMHEVYGSSEIQPAPVEVVHAKATQRFGGGLANAAIIQRQRVIALLTGKFGKAAIEFLRHGGGAGHHQIGASRPGRRKTVGRQRIAVGGCQGQALDSRCALGSRHGEPHQQVSKQILMVSLLTRT